MASNDQPEGDASSLNESDGNRDFLKELEKCFGTSDLYSVLNIEDRKCDSYRVKKAYHQLSIKVHPDRAKREERELATLKFQLLGRVYKTLSEADRRREYDQFGTIVKEEDICPGEAGSWDEYWRVYYPKILLAEVDKFAAEYQGSGDELCDLKEAYTRHGGDMDLIIEEMMCSSYSDDQRFRDILTPLVESGEIPNFERFTKESKRKRESRKRRGAKEAEEAKELMKEMELDLGGEKSLIAKIKARSADRADSFIGYLEKKYEETDVEVKKPRVSNPRKKGKSNRGGKK